MKRAALFLVVGVANLTLQREMRAQSDAKPLAFEVTSITINKTDQGGPSSFAFQPGGRLVGVNVPLLSLITTAYGLPGQPLPVSRIAGDPSWVRMDRFDIDAKASGDPDRAQMIEMLRTQLGTRFKLAAHHESREMSMYSLALARKDGRVAPQLLSSSEDCSQSVSPASTSQPTSGGRATWVPRPRCSVSYRPGNVIAGAATMGQVSTVLSTILRLPVRDDTGLSGRFDVDLAWTPVQPPRPPDVDPNGPMLFDAIQDQLGLKLESTKGPVDVLIIDHVEHPTED